MWCYSTDHNSSNVIDEVVEMADIINNVDIPRPPEQQFSIPPTGRDVFTGSIFY